ncbi:hypothetical protein NA63_1821 [Flavobacteriaceae bacterium MAR_2010_105]|nr:hypothetical protein NA63_1821 [Flavobacteriaceae bacterium MAR_2010_105]
MSKPTISIPSQYQNLRFFLIQFTMFSCFFFTLTITAQNKKQLIGHWQLQKISFKKTNVQPSETNKDQLLEVFKAALYNQITEEQKSNLYDLEQINLDAKALHDTYYQTTIEFQPNGAFYNTSLNKEKSLSGEYVLDKKKLHMQWETADKTNFKILKNTTDELVLKDTELKITFYYLKTKTQ